MIPKTDHLLLLLGQANELEAAAQFSLIPHAGAGTQRNAHVGKPKLDGDVLASRQFARDHSSDAAFAQIETAARHIFRNSGAQGDYIERRVDRLA